MKKFFFLLVVLSFVFPLKVFGLDDNLISNAKSGILIEANSGKIIYKKNINEEIPIASMTKMVSQIIILENIEKGNIKWNQMITVSRNAADMGGSQIYISEGDKISVEDLMKGISMASGNDATVQMAEVIAGSEEAFVKLMNKKVKQLGLKHTHFKNSTGLDEDGHYSSAGDMAVIARELVVNHPEILKFSSKYEDYLRENTKNKFWLVNTNKLIRFYDGADGLKTGHTDKAKYCLAATAKRGGLRLIGVVLGEESSKIRNSEAMSLLDYGFNTINYSLLKKKGSKIKNIYFNDGTKKFASLILKNNLGVISDKTNTKKSFKYKNIIYKNKLKYPIRKGQKIGKINVYDNGRIVSSSDLIIDSSIDKISFIKFFVNNYLDSMSGVMY